MQNVVMVDRNESTVDRFESMVDRFELLATQNSIVTATAADSFLACVAHGCNLVLLGLCYTPILVNSQPHVACFLICNRDLCGSDRPNSGTIVERIKNGID